MRRLAPAALLVTAVVAVAGCAPQPSSGVGAPPAPWIYGWERYFTLDWSPDARRGQPTVSGYVVSSYGTAAGNVRVLVESLDTSGHVAAWTLGWVPGGVPPFGRAYFEVPVQQRAPTYRVSVFSYQWVDDAGRNFE